MQSLKYRLIIILATTLAVLGLGTGWYMLVEGWTWIDAFYMTIITLTTVGFAEVRPLSDSSQLFTIFLILLGAGTVAYGLSSVGEYILTAGVVERIRERTIMRTVDRMQNHVIISGAGRVGETAGRALHEMGRDFVIIDIDAETVQSLSQRGWAALEGDSTNDEILLAAGIGRAAGILVSTGNDSDNLFIVLSARSLNPDLLIVARCLEPTNEPKMRRAGADKVVSPYQIGGRHMANVVVRPQVARFLDFVTLDTGLELWLEEVVIDETSTLAGKTVVETDLRRRTGVTIVALIRGDGKSLVTPDENTRLIAGDELIVLGTRKQLEELEGLVGKEVIGN